MSILYHLASSFIGGLVVYVVTSNLIAKNKYGVKLSMQMLISCLIYAVVQVTLILILSSTPQMISVLITTLLMIKYVAGVGSSEVAVLYMLNMIIAMPASLATMIVLDMLDINSNLIGGMLAYTSTIILCHCVSFSEMYKFFANRVKLTNVISTFVSIAVSAVLLSQHFIYDDIPLFMIPSTFIVFVILSWIIKHIDALEVMRQVQEIKEDESSDKLLKIQIQSILKRKNQRK